MPTPAPSVVAIRVSGRGTRPGASFQIPGVVGGPRTCAHVLVLPEVAILASSQVVHAFLSVVDGSSQGFNIRLHSARQVVDPPRQVRFCRPRVARECVVSPIESVDRRFDRGVCVFFLSAALVLQRFYRQMTFFVAEEQTHLLHRAWEKKSEWQTIPQQSQQMQCDFQYFTSFPNRFVGYPRRAPGTTSTSRLC